MNLDFQRIVRGLRHAAFVITEQVNDWRYGVSTGGEISPGDYGVDDGELHCYTATSYRRFRELMGYIDIKANQDVFLDFGSGLGRVVLLAATYPFRKVIGVELSAQLNEQARKNIEAARPRLTCQAIELNTVDARQYDIPQDVTHFYFWSPFGTDILKQVLENVRRSVQAAPREVTVLYIHAPGMSCLHPILSELPWLHIRKEGPLGSGLNFTLCGVSA